MTFDRNRWFECMRTPSIFEKSKERESSLAGFWFWNSKISESDKNLDFSRELLDNRTYRTSTWCEYCARKPRANLREDRWFNENMTFIETKLIFLWPWTFTFLGSKGIGIGRASIVFFFRRHCFSILWNPKQVVVVVAVVVAVVVVEFPVLCACFFARKFSASVGDNSLECSLRWVLVILGEGLPAGSVSQICGR